jgi:acetylglutamate kinase
LIAAKKSPTPAGVDLGFVGEVDNIDTSVIDASLNAIPVIAPIGTGADECFYNINADLVAGSIAETLNAEKLILLTNTIGLLDDKDELLTGFHSERIRHHDMHKLPWFGRFSDAV